MSHSLRQIEGHGTIAYKVAYSRLPGSDPIVAIFLSQVAYWSARSPDGWVWITHESLEEQTGLSRKQQDRAAAVLKDLAVLEKKLSGLPAKIHYLVDFDRLSTLVAGIGQAGGACPKRTPQHVPNGQPVVSQTDNHLYKEITEEITEESTHANEPQPLPQTFDPPTPLSEPAQTSGPVADPSTSTASPTTPGEPAATKRTRRKTAPSPSSAPPPPSLADNPPSLQEWVEYMKEREPLVPAMRAEFYYGKWTANGWCRQDGTPYRNWKGLAIQSIAFWKDSFGREYLELKREAQTAARAPEPERTYAPDDWDPTK